MAAVYPDFNIDTVGIFSYLEADAIVDTNVYASNVGLTVNPALTPITGRVYSTIQGAVDYFKGKAVSNCVISVAAGTYAEDIAIEGISASRPQDLIIRGDYDGTNRRFVGLSFMHHATFTWGNIPNVTGMGGQNGIITLSQQTTIIANDTIRVTNSVGAVDFSTAGVIIGDRLTIRSTAGVFTTHTVTEVGPGGVNTDLVVTPVVPAVAGNGGCVTFMPNREIQYVAVGTNIRSKCSLQGLGITGTGAGTLITITNTTLDIDNMFIYNGFRCMISIDSGICLGRNFSSTNTICTMALSTSGIYVQYGGTSNLSALQLYDGRFNSNLILRDKATFIGSYVSSNTANTCYYIEGSSYFESFRAYALTSNVGNTRGLIVTYSSIASVIQFQADTIATGTVVNPRIGINISISSIVSAENSSINNAYYGVRVYNGSTFTTISNTITMTGCTVNFDWNDFSALEFADNGSFGTPVANTTVVHDINGRYITTAISTNITTSLDIVIPGAGNFARGVLAYTFPLGYITISKAEFHGTIYTTVAGDTPEFGLGSTLANAAAATLGAAGATTEDLIEGVATAALVVTPGNSLDRSEIPTTYGSGHLDGTTTGAGAAITLYLNVADNWAAAKTVSLEGTITVDWTTAGDW